MEFKTKDYFDSLTDPLYIILVDERFKIGGIFRYPDDLGNKVRLLKTDKYWLIVPSRLLNDNTN